MISPARKVAFQLLCRIELQGAFSDYVTNSPAVAQLERLDRNLATELVYGTLRWQGFLDYILTRACSRRWERVDPKARILLRMSLYQMHHMDRIPDHALVNDAVNVAKAELPRGAAGFVNGVLRQLARSRPWQSEVFMSECPAWAAVSLPEWLWDRWAARFGSTAARQFALSLNEPPLNTIYLNSDRDVSSDVSSKLIPSGIVPGAYAWKGDRGDLQTKALRFQDEASQLIPHLLGDVTGWRIWDVCAAPGGKSAILRDLCGHSGIVVSSDLRMGRVARLSRFLELSSGRAVVLVMDAAQPPPFRIAFDAVLADAPCSGLGTLRRNPEIKWRIDPERLESLQESQISILSSAASAVRPGGFLVYATCSTEPEENEQVIQRFLAAHPNFRSVRPEHPRGVESWLDCNSFVKTFPSERLWDGFFAGLMLRDS